MSEALPQCCNGVAIRTTHVSAHGRTRGRRKPRRSQNPWDVAVRTEVAGSARSDSA
jgi:hypothetical protein